MLIISVLFMLVFGLTVAFSVNVPMFSTLRFFEGFCLAGITLSLYVLSKSLSLNQKFCANWPLAKLFPSSLLLLRTPVKLSIVAQHIRRFTMVMLTCTQNCWYFFETMDLKFHTEVYTCRIYISSQQPSILSAEMKTFDSRFVASWWMLILNWLTTLSPSDFIMFPADFFF